MVTFSDSVAACQNHVTLNHDPTPPVPGPSQSDRMAKPCASGRNGSRTNKKGSNDNTNNSSSSRSRSRSKKRRQPGRYTQDTFGGLHSQRCRKDKRSHESNRKISAKPDPVVWTAVEAKAVVEKNTNTCVKRNRML